MDNNQIVEGTTVYLPVNHPGALLSSRWTRAILHLVIDGHQSMIVGPVPNLASIRQPACGPPSFLRNLE
jgi:hypothetical protein